MVTGHTGGRILGIGVDVLHVSRMMRVLTKSDRSAFLLARRILSHTEFRQWHSIPSNDIGKQSRYLGVRWAVKEAMYKAISWRVYVTWKDVTMAHDEKGRPVVRFEKESMRLRFQPFVSVSHDGEYIFAQVLVTE